MRVLRAFVAVAAFALPLLTGAARADTKITIGKFVGGTALHLPTYVAMDQGFFKAEGLDASFVALGGKALVTGGLTGNIDFVPIPSGGAQAALSGAEIRYVVGESLSSQWVIVAGKDIAKPEDLKGKVLAYGRTGSADYDEGASVLARFFNLRAGPDYKVIAFQGEPERIAALLNDDVQGALVSVVSAVKAQNAGYKVLLRTSDYLPRVGGSIWTLKSFVDKNPQAVSQFIRAIAKAVLYIRDNEAGTIASFKTHLGVDNDHDAAFLWDQLHDTYGAELPPDLFREIFESRRLDMIAANEWPKDKPLPDTESFVTRNLLEAALNDIHYEPVKAKPGQ